MIKEEHKSWKTTQLRQQQTNRDLRQQHFFQHNPISFILLNELVAEQINTLTSINMCFEFVVYMIKIPGFAPMMGIPVPPKPSLSPPSPTGLPATPVPPVLIHTHVDTFFCLGV